MISLAYRRHVCLIVQRRYATELHARTDALAQSFLVSKLHRYPSLFLRASSPRLEPRRGCSSKERCPAVSLDTRRFFLGRHMNFCHSRLRYEGRSLPLKDGSQGWMWKDESSMEFGKEGTSEGLSSGRMDLYVGRYDWIPAYACNAMHLMMAHGHHNECAKTY